MRLLGVLVAVGSVLGLSCTSSAPRRFSVRAPAPVAKTASPPLSFEANAGQEDPRVRYSARARGLSLFLTDEGATMVTRDASWTMRVVGRAGPRTLVASQPLETTSSYFLGSDPARWRVGVSSVRKVKIPEILPGISQVFHGETGALEYDFEVSPGARPDAIELAFDGADSVSIGDAGELQVHASGATATEPAPRVYVRDGGQELAVAAGYRLTGLRSVAFDVGSYDPTKTLVIDPVLAYATYLGGAGDDSATAIAVDASGAMYVTGFTSSPNFPVGGPVDATLVGNDAVFVTKLRPDGQKLEYSTYLGGAQSAYAYGISVDGDGSAYVVGSTNSPDFPTVGALQGALSGSVDAFVAKLSPSGSSLVYSTYLGGPAEDTAAGVAVDGTGAAYVVGHTLGAFPLVAAAQSAFGGGTDAFVSKLAPSGAPLVYSTFVGGNSAEEGYGIAVDGTGAAYVTGYTQSFDFPVAPATGAFQSLLSGTQSAFVTKLAPSGSSFVYSTFLGGSVSDQGNAIAVDSAGAAYVTGAATSPDFPLKAPYQNQLLAVSGGSNAFVSKLNATGAALVYSTFVGGTGIDLGQGLAVDSAGNAYVAGATSSLDFPTASAVQSENAAAGAESGTNAFVTELAATGASLVYSTYLGGSSGDVAQGLAIGPAGTYVAGYTVSPNFPTRGAYQPELATMLSGGDNAFIAVVGSVPLSDAGVAVFDASASFGAGAPPSASTFDASEPVPDADRVAVTSAFGNDCSCRTAGPSQSSDSRRPVALVLTLTLALAARRRYGRERCSSAAQSSL